MFDRFLSWFGLARREDVVRLSETKDVLVRELKKAVAERDLEAFRRRVDREAFADAEAGHGRVVAFLLGEVLERSRS